MSQGAGPAQRGAGAGATRSRGPTGGDATVEPAKARRPPALARLRGAAAPGGRKLGAEWPRGDPGRRSHMRPSALLPARARPVRRRLVCGSAKLARHGVVGCARSARTPPPAFGTPGAGQLFERPSPARIPEGALFRPPTRPLVGMRQWSRPRRGGWPWTWTGALSPAPGAHLPAELAGTAPPSAGECAQAPTRGAVRLSAV